MTKTELIRILSEKKSDKNSKKHFEKFQHFLFFFEFSKILKNFQILEINFQYFGKFRKKSGKKTTTFFPKSDPLSLAPLTLP